MGQVYISAMNFDEITREILNVLKQLAPLSPTKIKKTCESVWNAQNGKPHEKSTRKPSDKELLNCYFNQTLGFECGIEKVAEQDGKKKLPADVDYDLIINVVAQTNALQNLTLRLPAPLSVRNFLGFQSATKRPKPEIKNDEIQAHQVGALLKGLEVSDYRKAMVLKALKEDIDVDEMLRRSEELHSQGFYVDEVLTFLAESTVVDKNV